MFSYSLKVHKLHEYHQTLSLSSLAAVFVSVRITVDACTSPTLSLFSPLEVLFALHAFSSTQEACRKVSIHPRATKRTMVFI